MIHWFDNRRDLTAFTDGLRDIAPQIEADILAKRGFPGWCGVCNKFTEFRVDVPADGSWCNLRETIMCKCGLNGRMRMVNEAVGEVLGTGTTDTRFVMMERVTPLFAAMQRRYPFVEGCEFFGADAVSGSMHDVGGTSVRHENMLALSYDDATFDVVFHGDVLEHVPDPVLALRECYRVLKPGGTLLFTVPFFFGHEEHVVRCRIVDGELQHLHPACYHGNPVSSSGALVFTEHGWPLLQEMRDVGFSAALVGITYDPFQGIVSNNNPYPVGHMWPVMFKAQKATATGRPSLMSNRVVKRIAAAVPGARLVRRELKRTLRALINVSEGHAIEVSDDAPPAAPSSVAEQAPSPLVPQWVPPGHFFSPIPSLDVLETGGDALFAPRELVGIDLREEKQLELLKTFASFYAEQPFPVQRTSERRYALDNPAYAFADGLALYSMIRHVKPKRIIEVGSGHSSCVILDTNELFFDNQIDCRFIEPYPELLQSLVRDSERASLKIIPKKVQELPLDAFSELEAGDILFIDSTHVAKIGGDVPYLYFEVLPRLPKGVFVHIHDVFYPMEYPKDWILEGRAWNEQYILQALLTFSSRFEVMYYSAYMFHRHRKFYEQNMPLYLRNAGAQIWLRS